jgi:hypothetical protein
MRIILHSLCVWVVNLYVKAIIAGNGKQVIINIHNIYISSSFMLYYINFNINFKVIVICYLEYFVV